MLVNIKQQTLICNVDELCVSLTKSELFCMTFENMVHYKFLLRLKL